MSHWSQIGAARVPWTLGILTLHSSFSNSRTCRFLVSMVRDGATLTQVGVMFDEEPTSRSEWVGKGADGFPVQEGRIIEVVGKHLIIRCAGMPRQPVED